jgi:hypothetical protein
MTTPKTAHCQAAIKLRTELDAELEANGQSVGEQLFWNAAELALLERLACVQDRIEDLTRDYSAAKTPKDRIRLSTELRLCDGAVRLLLKEISTEPPVTEELSAASLRARRAANARWNRVNKKAGSA